MMLLYFITASSFLLWMIRNVFFWTFLWQLKEYRFDRISIHLRETSQGSNLLFSQLSLVKWLTLIGYIASFFYPIPILLIQLVISAIYITEVAFIGHEFLIRTLKKPAVTFKSLLIVLLTLGVLLLFFYFPLINQYVWLLLIDRLIPLFVALFVFVFAIPTEFYQDYKVEKALIKIEEHRKLYKQKKKKFVVIGVTGSYGKSSTKEYVAQILSKKFEVLKTHGTNNTPIGIANTILSGLKKDTRIFVVEMGAYKKGEIEHMCKIVHPDIGILASVNEQHLSLFGNLQNTMKAKYELIESLPEYGIGIFNGNSSNAYQLFTTSEKQKTLCYVFLKKKPDAYIEKEIRKKYTVTAENIEVKKDMVLFDVVIHGKVQKMAAKLLGAHTIENMLPGIYIAWHLGMSLIEIRDVVLQLTPLSKTMVRHVLPSGATLVDDTFNANPAAAQAALAYMKIYKGKRVLVLQPMIELGKNARKEHVEIGKTAASVCDMMFVTNKNFYKDLQQGLNTIKTSCVIKIAAPGEIAKFIKRQIGKNDIVVFEGKEAAYSLDRIL